MRVVTPGGSGLAQPRRVLHRGAWSPPGSKRCDPKRLRNPPSCLHGSPWATSSTAALYVFLDAGGHTSTA